MCTVLRTILSMAVIGPLAACTASPSDISSTAVTGATLVSNEIKTPKKTFSSDVLLEIALERVIGSREKPFNIAQSY